MKRRIGNEDFTRTESIFYEPWLEKSSTIERHEELVPLDDIIEKRHEKNNIKDQAQMPPRKITQIERKKLKKIFKTELELWVMYLYEGFNRAAVDKNGNIVGQPTYQQVAEALGVDKNQVKKIVDCVRNRIKRLKK